MKGLIQIPGPFTGLDQYSFLPLVRPPALSTWTQSTVAGATFSDDPKWGIGITQPTNPATPCFLSRPVSPPYSVVAALIPNTDNNNFAGVFLWVSDGTKLEGFTVNTKVAPMTFALDKYTNISTYLSNLQGARPRTLYPPFWLRIDEDASHRTFYLSAEGSLWFQLFQEAAAAYLTTSAIGIGLNASTSNAASLRLLSWSGA